ncbi:MAG TPA: ABC transporter permease [Anaerolineae bacterium]|nr:ABC transporter permease [Anaerolineae bacterium]
MGNYILRRLFQIILTLVIFQTLLFLILDAQPGDITLQYLTDPRVTPEIRDQMRIALGLNKPPIERYLQWLRNFTTGNLGISFSHYPRPVLDIILERAPRTIVLFLTSTLVSFFVGFVLGKQLAWRRGGSFEYSMTMVGVVLYTIFTPWFALILIYLLGLRLGWLPVGKFLDPILWRDAPVDANYVFARLGFTGFVLGVLVAFMWLSTAGLSPVRRRSLRIVGLLVIIGTPLGLWALSDVGYLAGDMLEHMILPVAVATLVSFAGTMLMMRNTMLETLREDFVMASRAKGLSEAEVRDKHAARNAFLPVFTNLIISIPFVLSGGIITETVFSWPGMGLTLLQAVQNEDIPLAMGAMTCVGVLALFAHLFADVTYAFLDPRIRYQ